MLLIGQRCLSARRVPSASTEKPKNCALGKPNLVLVVFNVMLYSKQTPKNDLKFSFEQRFEVIRVA